MNEERYQLAVERISQIKDDKCVKEPYRAFFEREAAFLLEIVRLAEDLRNGVYKEASEAELEALNHRLYEELLPKNYDSCYGNPDVAAAAFGEEMGTLLCLLYAELRGVIVYAYEDREWDLLVSLELFLEIYSQFSDGEIPEGKTVRESLYWYMSDYSAEFVDYRTRELVDPTLSFARDIIMNEDLTDLRYLYRFGEYITENEKRTAAFLNSLPEEEIEAMARTWTEGYRIGFEVTGKDLSKKKTVNVRYTLGFERMVKAAIRQFKEMGLESILYRSASHAVNKRQHIRIGWYGAVPNPQFEYDHRNDAAVFLDEKFITRKLQALQNAFEHYKPEANTHAGPAVMETFGEIPFEPQAKATVPDLTEEQQKQQLRFTNESGQITNRYIIGSERSFTIIAYPVPAIGENFEEIFRETVKINTLDYMKYRGIQQKLIDALDQADHVRILGMNGNHTDLTVQLHTLTDPSKQTNFENCVADVNIPVGEVFTSPVLKGTNGVLHVTGVYLEGLHFENLEIRVSDGMVEDYSCTNFADRDDCRRYIAENILFRHPTIPMGEFAIGTNTSAYAMGRKFNIADNLPILIAEKTGPHFAFGDTCYSWQEDTVVYNPDGKEIIARDNEVSILRKEDPGKAYFGCHTDITIPYEELGSITAITADGREITLIRDGRFVLPGCEELNEALHRVFKNSTL